MMKITSEQLKMIMPYSSPQNRAKYVDLINLHCERYQISTKDRMCAYIAQIAHESGSLKYCKEIASGDAYDTRVDLGNTPEVDGDGRKYKGRGLVQLTGKSNYARLSKALGVDFVNNPDLLETPNYAVESSCWFWKTKGLNEIADVGDFKLITKRINGGLNGFKERLEFWERAKKCIN